MDENRCVIHTTIGYGSGSGSNGVPRPDPYPKVLHALPCICIDMYIYIELAPDVKTSVNHRC